MPGTTLPSKLCRRGYRPCAPKTLARSELWWAKRISSALYFLPHSAKMQFICNQTSKVPEYGKIGPPVKESSESLR